MNEYRRTRLQRGGQDRPLSPPAELKWPSSAIVDPPPRHSCSCPLSYSPQFLAPNPHKKTNSVPPTHISQLISLVYERTRRTTRAKGNFLNNRSVDFWYFRISLNATVPGRNRGFFRPLPAASLASLGLALFRIGEGARPPVLLRAVGFLCEVPEVVDPPPPMDFRDVEPTLPLGPAVLWDTVWAIVGVEVVERSEVKEIKVVRW